MTNTDAGAGAAGASGAGAAGAAAGGNVGSNGAAEPWYHGASTEDVGYLQSKCWDKDPKTAALGAIKSYRAVEGFVHAPPDQLVRWPKDASDAANWAKVHERLGVPADAKDYDLSGVKFADGSALDDKFVEAMRVGLKNGAVPKERATSIVQEVVKFMDAADASEGAERATKLQAERDALKLNWGNNLTPNLILAQAAAKRLNIDEAAITALEGQVGYAKVMEMFRDIGTRIGEDKYLSGAINSTGPLSKDMATAELASKMADHAWTQRLLAKDATAIMEYNNLTRVIAGV